MYAPLSRVIIRNNDLWRDTLALEFEVHSIPGKIKQTVMLCTVPTNGSINAANADICLFLHANLMAVVNTDTAGKEM
jgi:hypothetical protein